MHLASPFAGPDEFPPRLGHKVVVEGVEDQQQLDLLRIAGCDIVQGYHTGRPVELARLLEKIRAGAGARLALTA